MNTKRLTTRDYLNEEATTDEIDEEIENALEAWND